MVGFPDYRPGHAAQTPQLSQAGDGLQIKQPSPVTPRVAGPISIRMASEAIASHEEWTGFVVKARQREGFTALTESPRQQGTPVSDWGTPSLPEALGTAHCSSTQSMCDYGLGRRAVKHWPLCGHPPESLTGNDLPPSAILDLSKSELDWRRGQIRQRRAPSVAKTAQTAIRLNRTPDHALGFILCAYAASHWRRCSAEFGTG